MIIDADIVGSVARSFRWLGKHWEPITAVSALAISALSVWLAYNGLQLAYQGTLLAREAQKTAEKTAILGRAPMLMVSGHLDDGTLSISNVGVGPADATQFLFFYKDRVTSIRSIDPAIQNHETLAEFFDQTLKDLGIAPEGNLYQLGVPTRAYQAGENFVFFRISKLPETAKPALYRFFSDIAIAGCFMDFTGELKRVVFFGNIKYRDKWSCADDNKPYITF